MPPPSVTWLWLTLVATAGTCSVRRSCYVARARKGAVINAGLLPVTCSSPNPERSVPSLVTSAETSSQVSTCRVLLFQMPLSPVFTRGSPRASSTTSRLCPAPLCLCNEARSWEQPNTDTSAPVCIHACPNIATHGHGWRCSECRVSCQCRRSVS